ncbi:hypothetical protein BH09ACT12_BH09ACT12_14800 [soil metagenome]
MSSPSAPIPDLEPDAPSLISVDGHAALVGSRCTGCGGVGFPSRAVCYRCGSRATEQHPLGGAGTLYSWTTVHVSTARATPYDVGYVDMSVGGEPLRVFGQLRPVQAPWQIGQAVEVQPVEDTAEGWAFAAIGADR